MIKADSFFDDIHDTVIHKELLCTYKDCSFILYDRYYRGSVCVTFGVESSAAINYTKERIVDIEVAFKNNEGLDSIFCYGALFNFNKICELMSQIRIDPVYTSNKDILVHLDYYADCIYREFVQKKMCALILQSRWYAMCNRNNYSDDIRFCFSDIEDGKSLAKWQVIGDLLTEQSERYMKHVAKERVADFAMETMFDRETAEKIAEVVKNERVVAR